MPGIRHYRFDSLKIIPRVIVAVIVLAIIAAVAFAMPAKADPLPPGKPAGVRQASYNKRVEVNIFIGMGIATMVMAAVIIAPGSNSATSTK